MTHPSLWGSALWQALFGCARSATTNADLEALRELLFVQLPLLIPCAKCREHFVEKRRIVTRRAGLSEDGEPESSDAAVRWLYYLKDEVNKTLMLKRLRNPRKVAETLVTQKTYSSLSLAELWWRHAFQDNVVDDVAIGDMLVLVAMDARRRNVDDTYIAMCHTMARLLPLPSDSHLRLRLGVMVRHIVKNTTLAAKAARCERGVKELSEQHYRAFDEE